MDDGAVPGDSDESDAQSRVVSRAKIRAPQTQSGVKREENSRAKVHDPWTKVNQSLVLTDVLRSSAVVRVLPLVRVAAVPCIRNEFKMSFLQSN